ncbi:MAG: Ni/Fe hydrogenase subunit gamma [Planctomycetota bacterium]|nr:MAG: Ni/Fe hydrogenase subunit gamma [Planctomycetota bacterium]
MYAHETSAPATASDPMTPRWHRIRRVRRENHDTFTLELAAEIGDAIAFAPGQFNMLYAMGIGEAPISISGDPARTDSLVHTTRAVGNVTRALWRLRRGETIGVRGPFGTSWPLDAARGRDVVIVAGGIGLAPLRPALYRIAAERSAYERVSLLYGARTPDDLLYPYEYDSWNHDGAIGVQVSVDRAVAGWSGRIGVVTSLIPRAAFDPDSALAMVCGPEVMMRFAIDALRERGMTTDRIYVSLERNMKCGVELCGHCQFGPTFICKDGPVFRFDRIERWFGIREL